MTTAGDANATEGTTTNKTVVVARAMRQARAYFAADGEPCRAVPHAWLELEGRGGHLHGRAGAVRSRAESLGGPPRRRRDARALSAATRATGEPRAGARPPLTVLNVPVPVGGRDRPFPCACRLHPTRRRRCPARRARATAAGYRRRAAGTAADPGAVAELVERRCPSRSRRCITASRAQSLTWWGTRRRASRG